MLIPFITALAIAAAATPLVILAARRLGWVVEPRDDRWHRRPTAVFGGAAIYAAFVITFIIYGHHLASHWVLLLCASAIFLLGLIDDARELKPQIKLVIQLVVALVAVSQGVSLDKEIIPWPWLSIPLAVFWLVGITNAVNILDNMDGLAAGVVCVAGGALAAGSLMGHFTDLGPFAAMLAGASLGFLIYNFNPAKIFMGDCGSMFLGFTLAGITILSTNTAVGASHLALALLIPLGAVVVPLFDSTLVSFERTSHGRSIAQGGRDHSSHRLVFLGLSERRAVLLLLFISACGGAGSLLLAHFATPLAAAVIVALFLIGLLFFGVYLSEVKVYGESRGRKRRSLVLNQLILFKKQMLQILADLVLISAAYTAAWLLRFEATLGDWELGLLAVSLPWLLAAKMVSFWFFGLYRGDWRYLSVYDVMQILKGCTAGSILTVVLLALFYRLELFSRSVLVIDWCLAFMLVAGSRSLMRIFREKIRGRKGVPVLILGAGDGGEMLLRELRNNPSLSFVPVGFVDDDPLKQGRVIHGVTVAGTRQDLPGLISRHQVRHVFIAILSAQRQTFEDVFETCQGLGVECTRIQPLIDL
jgi:UDP-GlcNAc:undecaprenyl-phosphate GlcNAc-1-phosphate transferase